MPPSTSKSASVRPVLSNYWLLALFLALIAGSWIYYRHEQALARAEAERMLMTTADLKAAGIASWYHERLGDANLICNSELINENLRAALMAGDMAVSGKIVSDWMEHLRNNYNYESVILLDLGGRVKIKVPANYGVEPKHAFTEELLGLQSNNVTSIDLHREGPDKPLLIELLIPIPAADHKDSKVGALRLQINAERELLPLVQTGSISRDEVETLLLRRLGDAVEYLIFNANSNKFGQQLVVPLTETNRLSVQAALGFRGLHSGVDYRGNHVLAVVKSVPGTPWIIETKINLADVFQKGREELGFVLLLICMGVFMAGLTIRNLNQKQKLKLVQQALESEQHFIQSESRFKEIFDGSPTAIWDEDFSEVKKSLDDLRQAGGFSGFRAYFDAHPEMVRQLAAKVRVVQVNEAAYKMIGLSSSDQLINNLAVYLTETAFRVFKEEVIALAGGQCSFQSESTIVDSAGKVHVVELKLSVPHGHEESLSRVLVTLQDITQRKEQEAEISRLNRLYAVLSEINQSIVRTRDRNRLFSDVCRIIVEHGGFKMAWIGMVNPVTNQVEVVEKHGDHEGYLDSVKIFVDDGLLGRGPTGTCIREQRTYVCNDFSSDPATSPWHEAANKRGFNASLSTPVRFQGEVIGALMVYAVEKNFFGPKEVALIEEAALDVAFALENLALEENRRRAETALAESEAKLSQLFNGAPVGIFQSSAKGHLLHANPRLAEIFRFPDASKMVEAVRSIGDEFYTQPAERAKIVQAVLERTSGEHIEREVMMRRQDGTPMTALVRMRAVRDADGAVHYLEGFLEDITNRRLAEKALQESRSLLRLVLDTIPQAVFWKDRSSSYLGCNQTFARLAGLSSPEAVVGLTDFDLPWEQHESEAYRVDDRIVMETGSAKLHIVETQKPFNGSPRWLDTSKVPLVDAGGRIFGVLGVYEDITDLKGKEAEIVQARDYYLNLLQNAPNLMWRARTDAKCDWFNATWLNFTGRTVEQEMGDGWAEGVHPDDLERCLKLYLEAFEKRESFKMDYRLRRHDGQYRWIADNGVPFHDLSGQFGGYIGYCYDITDRKNREVKDRYHLETLQLLATGAPLPKVLESIVNLLECEHEDWRGSIMLVSESKDGKRYLHCGAATRLPQFFQDAVNGVPVAVGAGSCGTAAATKEKVIVENISVHPYWRDYAALAERAELRACWSLPIVSMHGEVLGALAVYRNVPSVPTAAELKTVEGVIGLAAVAIAKIKSEEALRQSEERMRVIGKNLPESFIHRFTITPDGRSRFIHISPSVEKVMGFTAEVIMEDADVLLGRIAPEWRQPFRDAVQKSLRERAEFQLELRAQRQDGQWRWLLAMSQPQQLSDGSVVWDGVTTDITGRKEAEAALLENRQRLQMALDAALMGVWEYDFVTGKLYWSPEIFRNLGLPRVEPSREMMLKLMHPEDVEISGKAMNKAVQQHAPYYCEYRVVINEKTIWIEDYGRIIRDEQDRPLKVIGTAQDITARKLAEDEAKRLMVAIDQSVEGIMFTDLEGRLIYMNSGYEKICGYRREELIGKKPGVLRSGKHTPEFYKNLWETISKGQVWRGHFINRRKDGTLFEEDTTITPIRNAKGEIISYVATKHDVTRESTLERQLIEAQKMEAIGQLAGGVAHDYNNILAATILQLGILMADPKLSPELREGLHELKKSADRATSLTRQLLMFSRRQAMERKTIELNALQDGSLKMLRRLLGEQIELSTNTQIQEAWIEADPGMIEQVIMNLCINARDAMPKGGKLSVGISRVELDATTQFHPEARSGSFICLSVRDTGSGMSPEVLGRIFEPFFTTKEVGKGTGLGLATVHGIVKQHQGWIEVTSELGKGSEFKVFLPAAAAKTGRRDAEHSTHIPHGTETILVVEDEPMLRRPLVRLLGLAGYKVHEAENGPEALKAWQGRAGELDLLITDMVMPGEMDGLELAESLQKLKPGLPVILTSGYSQTLLLAGKQERPGFKFLSKPCDPQKLCRTVREILDETRKRP